MRINNNIPALYAYNSVNSTNNSMQKSIQKLSSGLRINSAADDAAGLTISEKMRSQIKGMDQAIGNSQDGINMIQTAEGALNETTSILQRMRELSVQSANDTLTANDRQAVQAEVDQLTEEIDRISDTTQFNKKKLLNGDAAALTSTDKLKTKVFVKGGLRETDQFGQKTAAEGNYKISVDLKEAGKGQVQKTDIFKINTSGDVYDLTMAATATTNAGLEDFAAEGLNTAKYAIEADTAVAGAAGSGTNVAGMTYTKGVAADVFNGDASATFATPASIDTNASFVVEVASVDSATNIATYHIYGHGIKTDGTEVEIDVTTADVDLSGAAGNVDTDLGIGDDFRIAITGGGDVGDLAVGDKTVYYTTANTAAAHETLTLNSDETTTGNSGTADQTFGVFALDDGSIDNKTTTIKVMTLDSETGEVSDGKIDLTYGAFETSTTDLSFSFGDSAGKVANSTTKLTDIDKFYDASGKFMLDDPQTLTLVQGDGQKATVTLYADDTLGDVEDKLTSALYNDLGQSEIVSATDKDSLVQFVDMAEATDDTNLAVAGTFVINSSIAGADGEINFVGDEDLINALSLNEIQASQENRFSVDINDAHTGSSVASDVEITGNKLVGVVHNNVDVEFDTMADASVAWNDTSKSWDITTDSADYETTVHLADNTTVFQIGANQGEDMGINIGDMSAGALGVDNIQVTDRENAARSISVIDSAISKVSKQRSGLGAYQNRLEHTINNLTTGSTNITAAESRIRDVDMAKEMMKYTSLNVLMQAGNSMLGQAKQLPQNVLSLLR